MGFPSVTIFFSLALPFPNNFDEMGSHIYLMSHGQMDLKDGVDLQNDKHTTYSSLNNTMDHGKVNFLVTPEPNCGLQ